jgi:endonuclease/exonuclease/phosphatase family metal-dependent hydrolase
MRLQIKMVVILFILEFISSCTQKKNMPYDTINKLQTHQIDLSSEYKKQIIKIMSFNIQIFGSSKMAKQDVVHVLIDIISDYDLIAIQEVRSNTPDPVLMFMSLLPDKYDYILGPREGRSNSKEQFLIIYDTEKFSVHGINTWPDLEDNFERSPLGVYFKTKSNFDFILINNHIQPSDVQNEINSLPKVIDYFEGLWNETDILLLGDFNADGQYYDESLLDNIFPESEFNIIITNEYDTTLAESDNTYDRFIITGSAIEDYTGNFGVMRFDEMFDFNKMTILPKNVSDHFPIWAEFYIDSDTD